MKKKILSFGILLFAFALKAQNSVGSPKNMGIRLDIGLDYLQSSNRHLSYVNSDGGVFQANLAFEFENKKNYFQILGGLRSGELESKYTHFSPEYAEYNAEATYARSVWQNEKWNIKVGCSFSTNLWLQQYNFAEVTDIVTLISSRNLDLHTRTSYIINDKSNFIWSSSLGVVSKIRIQPYSTYDEFWIDDIENDALLKNGEFKTIPDVFRFRNTLSYNRILSKRFDFLCSFVINHSKYKDNKSIAFQSFGLQTSIKVKF
jgi:hypothetical protein